MSAALDRVKKACDALIQVSPETTNAFLRRLADRLERDTVLLLEANAKDLQRMDRADPKYDRLLLNEGRLKAIATDLRTVAQLPSPLGRQLEQRSLDNGLELEKIAVPLGVVGVIYEARPNVTWDVFSLCFKAGNAVVLKGGSDAAESNAAAVAIIQEELEAAGLTPDCIHLLPPEREAVAQLLDAVEYVDIIIPRGSQGLINYVREHSKVPVIETGAGVVHTYIDETADLDKAARIIHNAKTRRVSVCNALDTLILHEKQLENLTTLVQPLAESGVEVLADERSYEVLKGKYPLLRPAQTHAFGQEFLALRMAVRTVSSLDEALAHIAHYSSKHSEAIVTESAEHSATFLQRVDAACVYVNASTAFTDGAQFGMGAEIGISTQKLHARGPMALPELCSYKWLIKGSGQIRA